MPTSGCNIVSLRRRPIGGIRLLYSFGRVVVILTYFQFPFSIYDYTDTPEELFYMRFIIGAGMKTVCRPNNKQTISFTVMYLYITCQVYRLLCKMYSACSGMPITNFAYTHIAHLTFIIYKIHSQLYVIHVTDNRGKHSKFNEANFK